VKDGWQRLHPLSPAVRAGRGLAALVVVFVSSLGTHASLWNLVGHGAALAAGGAVGAAAWLVTRWRLEGDALRIESGLVRRSSLRYPLARLQAIDVVRPGFARLFGLAELRLRMGGSTGSGARLAYLTEVEAEALRERLLALAAGQAAEEEQAPPAWLHEQALATVRTPQLVVSLALSGLGLVTLGVLVALVLAAILAPSAAGAAVASGIAPLLGLATGVWRRFNGDYGMQVSDAPDGLRVRSGLVETTAETIPRGRVQAVRLVEPALWRPLGWARLEVDVAGRQRRKRENRSEGKQLRAVLPVGARAEALALLRRIVDEPPSPIAPPPRRARWKSPLRYRNLAVGGTDAVVVASTGRLGRRTSWVPLAKVQSLRWQQGPVQRRLRLGDVFVDTAGRALGTALRDRDAAEARTELDRLAALARAARLGEAG
jgi:putative membrane protein